MLCQICKKKLIKIATFTKPFFNEKIFTKKSLFKKNIFKCLSCNHHKIDSFDYKKVNKIYTRMYGKLAYSNFKNKFLKISAVKKENSSNYFRKKYIISNFKLNKNNKLLDFGSGTGIFPYSINKICDCYFHDKDKNSINFCKNFLNLKFANISKLKSSKPQFDYITCNKVLEHMSIQDIKKNLLIFKKLLKKSGKIYIELPDERASKKGYSRQEFFSEHINIFSIKSSKLFFSKLGFTINKISSLLEVTNKYTLRIILSKN